MIIKFKSKISKLLLVFILILTISVVLRIIIKKFIFPLAHFDVIQETAVEYKLDPYLILAIIKSESKFNNNAVSSKQAKGLMQILDSTANDVNENLKLVDELNENIYDVSLNISLGCNYFKKLLIKYNGNYYLAICAYNAGMGNVDKWIQQGLIGNTISNIKEAKKIPFSETRKYLKKVIVNYKLYRILYS